MQICVKITYLSLKVPIQGILNGKATTNLARFIGDEGEAARLAGVGPAAVEQHIELLDGAVHADQFQ